MSVWLYAKKKNNTKPANEYNVFFILCKEWRLLLQLTEPDGTLGAEQPSLNRSTETVSFFYLLDSLKKKKHTSDKYLRYREAPLYSNFQVIVYDTTLESDLIRC